MTNVLFDDVYAHLSNQSLTWAHGHVCPTLASAAKALPLESFYWPENHRYIWNLIHAIVACHTYAPRKFNNYSFMAYFGACMIAMSPSFTLRALVLGEPWGFIIQTELLPFLFIGMLIANIRGGLPDFLLRILSHLNQMSTVLSVESGVRFTQRVISAPASGSLILGTLHGGGGALWWILINSWFGDKQYRWDRIESNLPTWIILSICWNIFYWSNCATHSYVLQISLFFALVANNAWLPQLKRLVSFNSRSTTVPDSQSANMRVASSSSQSSTHSDSKYLKEKKEKKEKKD